MSYTFNSDKIVLKEIKMTQKQWTKAPEFKLDLKKKYIATFKTDKGDIKVELFAAKVPNTVNNFVFLPAKAFTTIRSSTV